MNRISIFSLTTVFLLGLILMSCEQGEPTDLTESTLIPRPVSVTASGDAFVLTGETEISAAADDQELEKIGRYLADFLGTATGFDLELRSGESAAGIVLQTDSSLPAEGYRLDISEDRILISGGSDAGVFYGIQTLRQLFPHEIESPSAQQVEWSVPTGMISDEPSYDYRGAMLDVARHFFPVEDVKRYIDFLAAYKMNYLHLHLTDDQGWRIHINTWPRLTEHGGSTEVGGGEGGYYTQDQYQEIVQYAADRFITIIPEIDMPGHTNAALASYPSLNCDGKERELYTGIDVGFSTLCVDKEVTYQFIDDVVRELAAMTPGPYIHVGGDESHSTKREDYLVFINRVKEIVESHSKIMIGWDETAQADLAVGSIVQLWANPDFATLAIDKGARLIMSPANKAYMDMQYDSTSRIGLHWAAYIEVSDAYMWDPAEIVEGIGKQHIMGVEAPLWTETVENMDDIEYLVFPRLPGYAEIAWTAREQRVWDEYKLRLADHGARMEAMGIGYYESPQVPWRADSTTTE